MMKDNRKIELLLVLLVSLSMALVSARPYAGGWNDGSRLAQVESLVDFNTLAIDQSMFVDPGRAGGGDSTPYPPQKPALMKSGTLDKIFVKGRFYSDKTPVPGFFMAAIYKVLQWTIGLKAQLRPSLFIYLMTLVSAGTAYIAAVISIYLLGRRLLPEKSMVFAVTASFALGSSALAYSRQVNSHEPLLAVACVLMLCIHSLAQRPVHSPAPGGLVAGMGVLAGLGYCLDMGAGPLLVITLGPLIYYRCLDMGSRKAAGMAALFLLSAFPLIFFHHAVNYSIGGTFIPANAVNEYLSWPGSPFAVSKAAVVNSPTSDFASGSWHHPGIGHFLVYSLELLFGKKGFLLHQPVLILAFLGGIAILIKKRDLLPELPEFLFSFAWSGAVWLIYSWGSTNSSGECATIRWFVPLLAPGYFVLMVLLRCEPYRFREFLALAAGGLLLSVLMWEHGPWMRMVPGYWFILAITLLMWSIAVLQKPKPRSTLQ